MRLPVSVPVASAILLIASVIVLAGCRETAPVVPNGDAALMPSAGEIRHLGLTFRALVKVGAATLSMSQHERRASVRRFTG